MKGFKVVDGDVSITDGYIDTVEGTELEIQTIKTVLETNKGEDPFDADEGINFGQVLGKGVTEDMVKTQITSGINQVNSDYTIDTFDYSVDKETRTSTTKFTARKSDGTAISISNDYN